MLGQYQQVNLGSKKLGVIEIIATGKKAITKEILLMQIIKTKKKKNIRIRSNDSVKTST